MENKKKYFEELYETYVKQIYRFIYLRVNNMQVAEDFTSETFVRCWKMIRNGKHIDNERALLYVIARGIIIDHYRSKQHTNEVQLDSVNEQNFFEEDETIEKLAKTEQIMKVFNKLKALKKEYQEIILLRFVEDLEYSEIATVMKKKQTNIRVMLHRAIDALKKQYE